MGFPDTASLCTRSGASCGTREVGPSSTARTRIIPEMTFTCHGTVTHWRAAGEFRDTGMTTTNSVLSIWRERSSELDTYDRVGEIELGICGSEDPAPSVMGMSNVYECTLPQSERVSVQPGDIVGIELSAANRAKFRLHFDNSGSGPANYEFNSHGHMFSLTGSTIIQDQPQISLTVDRTTVPPSSTTDALSTDLLTTQPPSTSTEATSMAATGPAPTEDSTMAMTTETQAFTNITGAPETTTMKTTVTTETTATEASNTQRNFPGTNGAMEQQSGSNVAAIAGAAVGSIIAVLLVLIIVLLLVLVLRRQNLNGQKFTPSNNSTIVNPVYDGKLIMLNLDRIFQIFTIHIQ